MMTPLVFLCNCQCHDSDTGARAAACVRIRYMSTSCHLCTLQTHRELFKVNLWLARPSRVEKGTQRCQIYTASVPRPARGSFRSGQGAPLGPLAKGIVRQCAFSVRLHSAVTATGGVQATCMQHHPIQTDSLGLNGHAVREHRHPNVPSISGTV